MKFSPNFKIFVYRLIVAGVFISISFVAGIWAYTSKIKNEINIIDLKNTTPAYLTVIEKGFIIQVNDKTINLTTEEIDNFFEKYTRNYNGKDNYRVNNDEIKEYLLAITPNINKEPQNARFQFSDNKASVFSPAIPGVRVNIEASVNNIASNLLAGSVGAAIITETVQPDITLEKINSLGINSLLATGESNFSGSSTSRIQNIKVASAKFNGLIIEPGKEISFNEILGEVDAASGYAEEKVIKNRKLVYELGGGICQVSTTLFRAAIKSGFEITERKPHAFPVQYYNPQGFDATIYPGVTDLKFINNTQKHIILQSKIIGTKLYFEIYGYDDGRKVTITGPFQYDQKDDGSLKAYFTRDIVSSDGQKQEDRFDSFYRSPSLYPLEKNPLE